MQTLLKFLRKAIWKLFSLLVMAALLVLTGCGFFQREQDGDEDTPGLAEYVVTLSQNSAALNIRPGIHSVVTVEVSGACQGDFIPPVCETFIPNWGVEVADGFGGTWELIPKPGSKNTYAYISFNPEQAEAAISTGGGPLSGRDKSTYLLFFPKNDRELRDVGQRRSRGRLDLKLKLPVIVPDQEEASPTEKRVTVSPGLLSMVLSPTQSSTTAEAVIKYTGPATTLQVNGPFDRSGLPGHAAKFLVLNPTSSSTPVAANGTKTLIVYFQVPLDDFNFYSANLTIAAGTGDPFYVILQGNRNR